MRRLDPDSRSLRSLLRDDSEAGAHAARLGQTVPYLRLNGVTPPEYSPF